MLHAANPVDELLEMACAEIERRAALLESAPGPLRTGAASFRQALATVTPIEAGVAAVPLIKQLDQIEGSAIAQLVQQAAPQLSWIPSPRTTDGGTRVALAPINDVRDLGALICGLMLLAPDAVYPEHSHPPHEIYLPIVGNGSWRYGGATDFQTLSDEALVYNHPDDVHSVVAGDEPVLALYVLWT